METQVLAAILAFAGAVALFFLGKRLEKRSVNKAILAEVDRLIEVVCEHETWWQGCIKGGRLAETLIPFSTDIYDKQVANIGAVDGEHVAQVVKFFGYVKFVNEFQQTKPSGTSGKELEVFASRYLGTLRRLLDNHDGAFEAAFAKYDIR